MSVVAICNSALAKIAVSQAISSLEEDSVEAALCRATYPEKLDELLEVAPWPFAQKRAKLAEVPDSARGGYAYTYYLPEDCIRVQEVWGGRRPRDARDRVPFIIENEAEVRVLLTDMPDAEIRYTARVTNTRAFSPSFRTALSWAIAADLAAGLTDKERLVQRAQAHYELARTRAIALTLGEGQGDPDADPPYIRARRGFR